MQSMVTLIALAFEPKERRENRVENIGELDSDACMFSPDSTKEGRWVDAKNLMFVSQHVMD